MRPTLLTGWQSRGVALNLVDEDAMREVLLKALVGSFEELQQLGHPEDPEPGGHLVDVGVDLVHLANFDFDQAAKPQMKRVE